MNFHDFKMPVQAQFNRMTKHDLFCVDLFAGAGEMSDPHEHYQDDFDDIEDDCPNCGGEGRVNDCIDGCCVDQDDIYCEYCSRPCDWCSPKKRSPQDSRND
jgi:hypothetical protein